jgi:hypothetical protein
MSVPLSCERTGQYTGRERKWEEEDGLPGQSVPKREESPYTPVVFVRVANKGGYGSDFCRSGKCSSYGETANATPGSFCMVIKGKSEKGYAWS